MPADLAKRCRDTRNRPFHDAGDLASGGGLSIECGIMSNPNHTMLIVHRGERREVVSRRGHLDLKTAVALATASGGALHAMRHLRELPERGRSELVRIVHGVKT